MVDPLEPPARYHDAKLTFSYGTMGSGKSTLALQIHHNLSSTGLKGLLCTQLDRNQGQVSSRLGVSADAVEVTTDVDLFALATSMYERHGKLDYLVCDEAQFYLPEQVEQLALVVDKIGADVYCFGLLTDFRGRLFPGTVRLLEMADESRELQVEARCWCGRPATHNARLVDGVQVYEGDLMVVDSAAGGDAQAAAPQGETTYELRCRKHWTSGKGRPAKTGTASADRSADTELAAANR